MPSKSNRLMKMAPTFDDFLTQIEAVKAKGSVKKLLESIPDIQKKLKQADIDYVDSKMDNWKAMITAMTSQERRDPDILTIQRIRRIARGSGSNEWEVIELLNRLNESRAVYARKPPPSKISP